MCDILFIFSEKQVECNPYKSMSSFIQGPYYFRYATSFNHACDAPIIQKSSLSNLAPHSKVVVFLEQSFSSSCRQWCLLSLPSGYCFKKAFRGQTIKRCIIYSISTFQTSTRNIPIDQSLEDRLELKR